MKEKQLLFLAFLVLMIFATMVIKSHFFNEKKELTTEDGINVEIKDIDYYKGFLILNDTIAVFEKTPRVFPESHYHHEKNYYRFLESIKEPYHLFKKPNNDTLVVIKGDTLFYKLLPD